jgi:thioredoxin 1
MKKAILILLFAFIAVLCFSQEVEKDSTIVKPKITFLELGSTTCVPCKMMEPVLESIREKYGDQIEVIFHDVKKDKEIALKYQIRMIPTQVFLDENGIEIHRHLGFYPEEQIDEFLQKQDLMIVLTEEE